MGSSTLDALSAYALPPLPSLTLPPLPPINDPEYYEIVTTHASVRKSAHSNHELNPKVMLKDYEKLEHVGDALLGAVVAVILHDLFPMIGEGPASMLKGQLVSNAILAQISERYGLPALLRTDPGAQYIVRKQVKAQASVFEAWVAGVYYTVLDSMAAEDEGSEDESEDEDTDGDEEQGKSKEQSQESESDESEPASEIDQDAIAKPADQEVSDVVACKGQQALEDDSAEAGKDAEKEENARGRAAGRTVRFVEEVKVEVLEPTSPGSSSSGLPTPTIEAQDATASDSTADPCAQQGPQEHNDSEGDRSEDASSSASSDSGDASDCPFAGLLKVTKHAKVNRPPSPASSSPADESSPPPVGDTASGDAPSHSLSTASVPPSHLDKHATNAVPATRPSSSPSPVPNTTPTPRTPSTAQQNAIRLRWLAMCVLDDWLRPIFTPLALWAMDCLRAEQVRIRAARKPAQAVVDALDAKTKGCMAIMHNLVQAGEVGVPVYEVQQIDKREGEISGYWKVVCSVTAKSGDVFTAESVRTAKKPAQNIATYRVLLQLGQVEDAEELAKCRSGSSTGASSEAGDALDDELAARQAGEVIDGALGGSAPAGDAEQA